MTRLFETPYKIEEPPEEKASRQPTVLVGMHANYQPSWPGAHPTRLSKEGFAANVTAYACIRLISDAVAGVPWYLQRRGKTRTSKITKVLSAATAHKAWSTPWKRKAVAVAEIEDHPLLKLLERPNPYERTGSALLRNFTGYCLISGNGYMEIVAEGARPPLELWSMRSDRVKVKTQTQVHREGDLIEGYVYSMAGGDRGVFYYPHEVMHLKLFAGFESDYYGMSPLMAAARVVDVDNEALRWVYYILKNDARPGGAFVTKASLTEQSYQRAKKEMKETLQAAKNAGRPLLLDSGLEWHRYEMTPGETAIWEGKGKAKEEIALAFLVAPELVGGEKKYSNYAEAKRALYTEPVLPFMDQLRDAMNEDIARRYGDGLYLDYDKDQIEALQEDQERLWNRISTASDLTVNEKRVLRGYDERPEGDVILVSSGDVPLEGIEERSEPDPVEPTIQQLPPKEQGEPAPKEKPDMKALNGRMQRLLLYMGEMQ